MLSRYIWVGIIGFGLIALGLTHFLISLDSKAWMDAYIKSMHVESRQVFHDLRTGENTVIDQSACAPGQSEVITMGQGGVHFACLQSFTGKQ